jgi:non-canonical purine NTP pyrophosphatase (RdgB/HAM1 family)
MSYETIHLLTGNEDKLRIAKNIFGEYGINVEKSDINIPEIQAETSKEVASYATKIAFQELGVAVLREDHSFYIDELGIPGPFMAYMDKTVSVEQLIKITDTLKSRDAHFEIAASYVDINGNNFECSYDVPVTIANAPRGDNKLNWERAMILPGSVTTFAETDSRTRDHLWSQNYHSIAHHIIERTTEY